MPSTIDAMRGRTGGAVGRAGAPGTLIRRKLGDILFDSFFQYAINFAYVTGVEALQGVIQIQTDAHFLCVETVYDLALTAVPAIVATGLGVVPQAGSGGCLVQLTDGGTQRQLSNILVPASTLFGTSQRPFVWPFTHLFKAGASIGIASTGVSAALMANTTVRYVFCGFKIPINTAQDLGL